jgi:hypothetical protein
MKQIINTLTTILKEIKNSSLTILLTNSKYTIVFLLSIYSIYFVLLISGLLVFKSNPIRFVLFSIPLYIPFIVMCIYIYESDIYTAVKEQIWFKITSKLFILIYSVFALSYAMNQVNHIFNVDPKLFPITISFLTFSYFPIFLLDILNTPTIAIQVFSGLWIMIIFMKKIANSHIKWIDSIKEFLYFSLFLFVLSITHSLLNLYKYKLSKNFAIEVALKTDFMTEHRCVNLKNKHIDGVLFLSDNNVLTYTKDSKNPLEVQICNYK